MFGWVSRVSVLVVLFFFMIGSVALAAPWPGSSTGTDLGDDLTSGFEPSGIVWDNFTGALWLVGGANNVSRMLSDGNATENWTFSGVQDLESITVTGTTQKLYLGGENPPTIWEYNSSSTAAPSSANKSWVLDLPVSGNSGMEGLAWVPNGYHPYPNSSSGGLFYASTQYDGTIYVYDVNLSQSGSAILGHIDSFTPDPTQTDISDLYFSTDTRTLFVLYDAANKVLEVDTSTENYSIMSFYTLPSSTTGQEGVTLLPQCPGATTNFYLADDEENLAHRVYSFDGYPQLCTTVLAPTADATTNQAASGTNYGLSSSLTVDSATGANRNFLIRFNLSGINTSQIARGRILFYVTDATDLIPQYCTTSASWSETSVTWNNQPICNGSNSWSAAVSTPWVSYNVLSSLQSGASSFRFTPRSSNDFVANSRQGSNPPRLILWMSGQ